MTKPRQKPVQRRKSPKAGNRGAQRHVAEPNRLPRTSSASTHLWDHHWPSFGLDSHEVFCPTISASNMPSPSTFDHYEPDMSLPIEDRVRGILDVYINTAPQGLWDTRLRHECIAFISASTSPPSVVYELSVEPYLCNAGEILHGGCASTILDFVTSSALFTMAKPGCFNRLGLSRTFTLTYLRPIPKGTRVRVEAEVVSAGKTMVNVKGVIKTLDGKVCTTCVHDMAIPTLKL